MSNHQISDESLVLDIKEGDKDAFAELYERYKKILFAFFYNYSQDASHSEDMVQVTFEKVLKYLPNYRGIGSFKSWIFSVARNLHIDHHRKAKRIEVAELETVNPKNILHNSQEDNVFDSRMGILEKAINSLDPDKKELLVLTKIKGLKYKDVAEMYQVNEGTIKVRMCRIMKELKTITLQYASSQD